MKQQTAKSGRGVKVLLAVLLVLVLVGGGFFILQRMNSGAQEMAIHTMNYLLEHNSDDIQREVNLIINGSSISPDQEVADFPKVAKTRAFAETFQSYCNTELSNGELYKICQNIHSLKILECDNKAVVDAATNVLERAKEEYFLSGDAVKVLQFLTAVSALTNYADEQEQGPVYPTAQNLISCQEAADVIRQIQPDLELVCVTDGQGGYYDQEENRSGVKSGFSHEELYEGSSLSYSISKHAEYYGDFATIDSETRAPRVTGEDWEDDVLSEYDSSATTLYFRGEIVHLPGFLDPLKDGFYKDVPCYYCPELGTLVVMENSTFNDTDSFFYFYDTDGEHVIYYSEQFQ